jgi:hypothetical protein
MSTTILFIADLHHLDASSLWREVFSDRVPVDRGVSWAHYFGDHADTFYKIAQRKFAAGEMNNGIIEISNADNCGPPYTRHRSGLDGTPQYLMPNQKIRWSEV